MRRLYENAGLDVKPIYRYYGLADEQFEIEGRFPHEATSLVWRDVERLSGDRHIGLHLAEPLSFSGINVVFYLMLCSETLGQALQQLTKFQRLLSDAMQLRVTKDDRTAIFHYDLVPTSIPPTTNQLDFWVLKFANLFAFLGGDAFAPTEVHFKHGKGSRDDEYQRIFNCKTRFDREINAIVFPADLLNLRIEYANPDVFFSLQRQADRLTNQIRNGSWKENVTQRLLAELCSSGRVRGMAELAQRMAISQRTLSRRLAAEDVGFHDIADEVRREISVYRLTNTDLFYCRDRIQRWIPRHEQFLQGVQEVEGSNAFTVPSERQRSPLEVLADDAN